MVQDTFYLHQLTAIALRKFMAAVVLLSAFMKALTKLMVASCTSPVLALIVACRKFVIASITWVEGSLGKIGFKTVLNGELSRNE